MLTEWKKRCFLAYKKQTCASEINLNKALFDYLKLWERSVNTLLTIIEAYLKYCIFVSEAKGISNLNLKVKIENIIRTRLSKLGKEIITKIQEIIQEIAPNFTDVQVIDSEY